MTAIIKRSRGRLGLVASIIGGVCLLAPGSALATASAPAWTISASAQPTNFTPGDSTGDDTYVVTATNSGGAPTDGSPITITDTLPAGLTPHPGGSCASSGQVVTCTFSQTTLAPGENVQAPIPVDVSTGAPASVSNAVSVAGGGAGNASASQPTTISATPAGFGIARFDGGVTNADGSPDTQAGSHPYDATTSFDLNTGGFSKNGSTAPAGGNFKDVRVALPPGLVGDPSAAPQCPRQDLDDATIAQGLYQCPTDTQVGVLTTYSSGGFVLVTVPVYNMVPPPGLPAQFAAPVIVGPVFIDISVRTGSDYGLTATLTGLSALTPITGSSLTFWGVPADPSHDPQRFCGGTGNVGCPSGVAPKPFLTLPTSCAGPQTTTLSTDDWQDPGAFKTASFVSHDNFGTPIGADGCNRLDFSPSISVQPDTTAADSAAGLDVDLKVPQNDNPTGLAEANLKTAVVTLPQGVSVNPASADGLAACSPAQIGLDNANEPACPDASKIGSVEVDTPVLADHLLGGVYLAQQGANPFGSLLAIYVTAEADGVLVKLAGHVVPDPVTGQLTTSFDNNPQLPFSDFKLHFFGGPHAALATPETCGTFTTTSDLAPWSAPDSAPDATPSDSFSIDTGCVGGFAPLFSAGTQNAQAGAYSPFVLSFSRSDTDQNFSGLSVKLPPGMLAKLAGVGECSDAQLASISGSAGTGAAQAASPSCPASSQVGTATTGAGAGSGPFYLGGKAYLTGPYKGAPYGLAVVVPALAGPYDLGTVVVRQALYVDPTTAQVTAVSDPFPTILQGIPLRIRRIDVNLNRPNFTINPTSCDPMSVTGILSSTGGLSAPVSSRFQVGGCQELGFSPKLKMALTGKGKTRSGAHPSLVSTLTQPFGQANIHNVKVTLPLSMALDPNNSQHVCNYDAALAVHGGAVPCPASTIVGTATVLTPLLSQPLTGKVYLVQGIRFSHGNRIRTLPSLLIPLRGQINLDLRANTSVNGASALVTTFSTIPDAPVSKFTLTITGGKKGLLVITGRGRTICNAAQTTTATLAAQSGKTENSSIRMSTPCGKIHKAKKHKKHPRRS